MFENTQFPIVVQTSLNHSSHFLQNKLHPANLEVATWCDAEIAKLYLLNEKLQPLVLSWLNNLPSFLRVRQPIIVRTRFLVSGTSLWFKKGPCMSFGSGCCNNIQAMPASDPSLFVTIFSVRKNAPYTSMVHDHFPWDFGGVPPAVIARKDSTLDHCLQICLPSLFRLFGRLQCDLVFFFALRRWLR